jgi:purine-binding chemotaxis protein CheW
MNDLRGSLSGLPPQSDAQRAEVFDLMRRTLAAINRGQVPGGELTPEAVEQIARGLGATDPAQIDALLRIMGMSPDSAQAPGAPQHIVFDVSGALCALPSQAVQGVEREFDVTPLPNVAPWLLGIAQLWGSIISVVDLPAFLGLNSAGVTSRSRILAVTGRDMQIGFLVDGVTEIRTMGAAIRRDDVSSVPSWARAYIDGTAQIGERSILVLDAEKLLYNERIHRYRADERS